VNVAAQLVAEQLHKSRCGGVSRLAELLREHSSNLERFLTEDERGRQVPEYLKRLGEHLELERSQMTKEFEELRRNIEHIKEIVAMQQNYATVSGILETVELTALADDALRIHGGAYERHGITVTREQEKLPAISVDKHRVLQILVNLLSNAKYACEATDKKDKRVMVRLKTGGPGMVRIEVADNGAGIAQENLTRIFSQGFTTRKGGHGFGLHSGALAAKEAGGSLSAQSDGPGLGATFILELPISPTRDSTRKGPLPNPAA
jgi:signal transduction histidine kinase